MFIESESGLSDMGDFAAIAALIGAAAHELVLFAAVLFLIGGLDDLLVDLVWTTHALWRHLFIFTRHSRADLTSLALPERSGWLAVFVPAWREDAVIAQMLSTALERFDHSDYTLYVGVYPNDPATIAAVASVAEHDSRIRMMVNARPGPTTKADCLNALWRAMRRDEAARGKSVKAIVLHDAEDYVHSGELKIFDTLIERFDLVQLPVLPLIDKGSRWVSGHYCDEFAEAHGKSVVAREVLGAAVPSAGVGCAFARDALDRIARAKGGLPFDSDSLTEDYELGLRIAEQGGSGIFVRLPAKRGGKPVAVRAHFPSTVSAAVHQKSRWMTGIALAGWDRLGWRGGPSEFWMRLRDRRALIAVVVLAAAYAGLLLTVAAFVLQPLAGISAPPPSRAMTLLLQVNAALLGWRLMVRAAFVTHAYGLAEGLRSIPRVLIANIIEMMAARAAVMRYLRMRRGGAIEWGKTAHVFPETAPVE